MNIKFEGFNFCLKLDHEIDNELVNIINPKCIKKNNGCGNCSYCKYKERIWKENKIISERIY